MSGNMSRGMSYTHSYNPGARTQCKTDHNDEYESTSTHNVIAMLV